MVYLEQHKYSVHSTYTLAQRDELLATETRSPEVMIGHVRRYASRRAPSDGNGRWIECNEEREEGDWIIL